MKKLILLIIFSLSAVGMVSAQSEISAAKDIIKHIDRLGKRKITFPPLAAVQKIGDEREKSCIKR